MDTLPDLDVYGASGILGKGTGTGVVGSSTSDRDCVDVIIGSWGRGSVVLGSSSGRLGRADARLADGGWTGTRWLVCTGVIGTGIFRNVLGIMASCGAAGRKCTLLHSATPVGVSRM